jgi:hypothetical protein
MELPAATVKRKIRSGYTLSKTAGEHVLSIARLIGQVQKMVQESGNPEGFEPAVWLAKWLAEPNPALGSITPGEYMDTAEGLSAVCFKWRLD